MRSLKHEIEDSAAEGLKKLDPKLFDLIDTGIRRDKLTPKKVDKYIQYRFGLKKGHPVRDMCYLAAVSIERKSKQSAIINLNSEITTPRPSA